MRQALGKCDGSPQAGEAARPHPDGDSVEIRGGEAGLGQDLGGKARQESGVATRGLGLAGGDDRILIEQGDGAARQRALDAKNPHGPRL